MGQRQFNCTCFLPGQNCFLKLTLAPRWRNTQIEEKALLPIAWPQPDPAIANRFGLALGKEQVGWWISKTENVDPHVIEVANGEMIGLTPVGPELDPCQRRRRSE
jgi:hypothetical protein